MCVQLVRAPPPFLRAELFVCAGAVALLCGAYYLRKQVA